MRQRLDVGDERRAAPETALVRGRAGRSWVSRGPPSRPWRQRRFLTGERRPASGSAVAHVRRRGARRAHDARPPAPPRPRPWTATITSLAPAASAASNAPSITRCGASSRSVRSFALSGSLSAPLTTSAWRPRRLATARSLVAVGNAAPPRPRSPAAATVSINVSPRQVTSPRRSAVGRVLGERQRARGPRVGRRGRAGGLRRSSRCLHDRGARDGSADAVTGEREVGVHTDGVAASGPQQRFEGRATQCVDLALELTGRGYGGPRVTDERCIVTPPPAASDPSIRTRRTPGGPSISRIRRLTTADPLGARALPQGAPNGGRGRSAQTAEPAAAACRSNAAGVPARRAQPSASGPTGSHAPMTTPATTVAPSAVPRTRAFSDQPLASLQAIAPRTAAAQASVAASIHGVRVSEPVPQTVDERDRPAADRRASGPPARRPARACRRSRLVHSERQDQVERHCAQAEPDRAVARRRTGARASTQPDRGEAVEHRRQHVDRDATRPRAARWRGGRRHDHEARPSAPSAGRWSTIPSTTLAVSSSRATTVRCRAVEVPAGAEGPAARRSRLRRSRRGHACQSVERRPAARVTRRAGKAGAWRATRGAAVRRARSRRCSRRWHRRTSRRPRCTVRQYFAPPVARARVDDVMRIPARRRQRRTVVLDVDRPPEAIVTVWPGLFRIGQRGRRSRAPTSPALGASPAVAMSPPRLTSTPTAQPAARARCAARSAASALAVAPRSRTTPGVPRTVWASRSSSTTRQPGTRAARHAQLRAVLDDSRSRGRSPRARSAPPTVGSTRPAVSSAARNAT